MPLTDTLVDLARDMRQEAFQRAPAAGAEAAPRDLRCRHHADRPGGGDHHHRLDASSAPNPRSQQLPLSMAERPLASLEQRRGSSCQASVLLVPRWDRAQVTIFELPGEDPDRRLPRRDARSVAAFASSAPAALLGPRGADARAGRGLSSGRARPVGADPAADRRRLGVLLLHAGHAAAGRAPLRQGGGQAVLGDAGRRLRLGREACATTEATTLVGCRRFYPLIARRGRGRAAALDRQAGAGLASARGGAVGADAARARHARLAGQDPVRHGLRGARAGAPDRARPGGRRRGGAAARRGRRAGAPRGARDHRRPARRRRRAAPADRGPRGGGAALGRGQRRARGADGRRGRRAAPGRLARARVDPARGARQRRRHARASVAGAAAAARGPRGADRGRRRAGFEVPDELVELAQGHTSGSPACASARSWRAGT